MFQAEAIGVEGALGERPVVHFVHDGYREKLSCEWVAGCDGFHGIARHVVPASTRRVYEHSTRTPGSVSWPKSLRPGS